jgi:hypothetical protein
LAQIDVAATLNQSCLCFKYHDHVEEEWTEAAFIHANIPTMDLPISGTIEGKGALVAAKDGKCVNQTFYVSKIDEVEVGEPLHDTPFYIDYMPLASEVDIPMPPRLVANENPWIFGHKIVPVVNEACLYSLWMCACWANQADGCLCAFENPGKNDITLIRPQMGKCPDGSSDLMYTGAAGPGYGNFATDGAGALALKCSPNPCQACCKGQGGSCSGCGGKGGKGCGGGKGCPRKGKKGGCGGGGIKID